jgi:uncharacterized protein YjbI with pentapeptide repeats
LLANSAKKETRSDEVAHASFMTPNVLDSPDPAVRLANYVKLDQPCDLANVGDRRIEAEQLKRLLTVPADGLNQETGLQLENAIVNGDLEDFRGVTLPPVSMKRCEFLGAVDFGGAIFHGNVCFDESRFTQTAEFSETVLSGNATFSSAIFNQADFYKATIKGDARFEHAIFGAILKDKKLLDTGSEPARFQRTEFNRDAYFCDANFYCDVTFDRASFEGDVYFGLVDDEQEAHNETKKCTRAATFSRAASFTCSRFDGRAWFTSATFRAGVDFYLATITADAHFERVTFKGNGNEPRARFDRTTFKGVAEFGNAEFGVPALFSHASFAGDANFCGKSDAPSTENGMIFNYCANFDHADAVGKVNFSGATFRNVANFERAVFSAGMYFENAKFGPDAELTAEGMTTDILNLRFENNPKSLDLKDATINTIKDGKQSWPPRRRLTGCAYKRIEADEREDQLSLPYRKVFGGIARRLQNWQARNRTSEDKMSLQGRIEWVKGQPGYDPFRYDQMIAAYRLAGDVPYASRMALAKQRERRGTLTLPGKIWGVIQDRTVGYGYRLWLPIVWIAALGLVGSYFFRQDQPPAKHDGWPPAFESVVYTMDLLFPLASLGERANFEFSDWRRWLAVAFMVAGWVLAAAVLAGLQRLLTRPDKDK